MGAWGESTFFTVSHHAHRHDTQVDHIHYSSYCLCYIICIHFCKFQQHGTKRQEVGTVKGVVWEEERLPIQHIFYSNRILLAIITMQGMISHTMYSQWCLK